MAKQPIRRAARNVSQTQAKSSPRKTAPSRDTPRARLLTAATRLFCKHGINATGVDAIIASAGTAKTTLYKEFGSKENLVHIVLETEGKQWRDWLFAEIERGGGDARARLIRVFAALKHWFAQDSFFGCPFINAIGEHDKSDKALRTITLRHKRVVLTYLAALARDAGVPSPDAFAHQIALLVDGAIVAAMVTGDPKVADTAALAAKSLIETIAAPPRLTRKPQSSRKLEAA